MSRRSRAKVVGRKAGDLTPRQRKFAVEYARDLDGGAAAKRAGYAPRSARFQASKLLRNVAVAAAIAEELGKSLAAARLEVERVDQEIARIAFCDLRRLFRANGTVKPPAEWDAGLAAAVASFEVHERRVAGGNGKRRGVVRVTRIRFAEKIGALMLGARRLGLLRDTVRISGALKLEALVLASLERKDEPKPAPAGTQGPAPAQALKAK